MIIIDFCLKYIAKEVSYCNCTVQCRYMSSTVKEMNINCCPRSAYWYICRFGGQLYSSSI